jgi:N-methylhydantoinase A
VVRESELFCDGAWRAARIYERGKLQAGDVFSGPAVIAEYSATTYMPPGSTATVDKFSNLVIEVGA